MSVTTALTYPLDLLHTRLSADNTPMTRQRVLNSTFQCFNRTNLDEGRLGLYKGVEFALMGGLIRAMLQLPIYDLVKWSANKAGADNTNTQLG